MSDSEDCDDGKVTSKDIPPAKEKRYDSDGEEEAEEGGEDEDSVVERSSDLFGDDEDEEEQQQLQIQQQLALMDEDDMGAQSQVPRGFMERMFWNESDVKFRNDTNREVLFIIADEEFTMQRTTKMGAGLNDGDDDDDDDDNDDGGLLGGMNNFGLNLIPLKATAYANTSTTVTQHALKTRCMPVAPKSHSTQHFQQERLTYVTALTKDVDGEGQPWTRVHYENKVINCQRTKSLTFSGKHLRVSAYRITQQQKKQQQPQGLLQNQKQSSKRRLAATASPSSSSTNGSSSRALVVRQKSNKRIRTID